ncbi:MAG: hypothetical protein RRZ93_08595, partial [Ruthenibacterium sp.]
FYYRWPPRLEPVFFNERYQNAGMAKNDRADTVLMGTSMVANYRVSKVEQTFGGSAVKLTFPDGFLSEFDDALRLVFKHNAPERVIFGLDINILIRDEAKKTDALPEYLYNDNPFDDIKYLLNKDTLYYSLYTAKSNVWGTAQSVDEAYTWDGTVGWSKATALAGYDRPPVSGKVLAQDAYLQQCAENLAVVRRWIEAHPETEFDIFFPPYSILYWDREQRNGSTEAVFAALNAAFDALLPYENVKLYFYPAEQELIANLHNYGDYIHHSGEVCTRLLGELKADEWRVTDANREKMLADLHTFVIDYDYESIWTTP